jgi:hypothetical protein
MYANTATDYPLYELAMFPLFFYFLRTWWHLKGQVTWEVWREGGALECGNDKKKKGEKVKKTSCLLWIGIVHVTYHVNAFFFPIIGIWMSWQLL